MSISASFVGRAGADAELKNLPSGEQVLEVRVATDTYSSKTKSKETQWVSVSMFGKRAAGVAAYITKGKPIFVTGTIHNREYTRKDGTPGVSLEMKATDLELIGTKDGQTSNKTEKETTDYIAF